MSKVAEVYSLASNSGKSTTITTSRRDLLNTCIGSSAASISLLGFNSQPAFALKPNNEALCGTGFFENIYQYKCTNIGDISDEGTSRNLSSIEEDKLNSLMGKFDLGGSDFASGSDSNEIAGDEKDKGSVKGERGGKGR